MRGDDKTYPRNSTGFTPEDAAKPENWFEAHTNMEIQANHNRKYDEIHVGDKVKVWQQKSVHDKEVVSDFPDEPVEVKKIVRSLGQTRYVVEGKTISALRSDLRLHRPGERKDTKLSKPEPYKEEAAEKRREEAKARAIEARKSKRA